MCVRAIQLVSDRLCLTDPEWQSKELVGEAEMWKKAGILRSTKRYTTVDCDCDEQLHQADVLEFERDGKTKYMAFCALTGGAREVKEEELVGYTFQPRKMAELFHSLLKCREEVEELIPGRLWKMGRTGVPIAGRSRDIYFTPRLNDEPQDIYAALPDAKTPLLIVGSSRFSKSPENPFEDNRVISLDAILMIQDDKWVLDMEWLHQLACDGLDEEPEPVDKGSRADTVDAVKNVLYEHLRSAYSYYCDQIEKGNGRKLLKPPTMAWIGKQVGKDRTTVSRIIEPDVPDRNARYLEVHALWKACNDIDLLAQYGQSHWGNKNLRYRAS